MSAVSKYGKKTGLALDTWVKLARGFYSVNKRAMENIKSHGLTYPQFSVVEILGHLGPLKVGQITDKMLISGGNMTLVLDQLEDMEYLERVHSKSDRRAINIQLTKKGQKFFEEIFPPHAETLTDLLSVLSAQEQKDLGSILKKLGHGIEEKFK